MQALCIQDYQMHNNVPRNYFLFSCDVGQHQWKSVRHSLIITCEMVSTIFASVLKMTKSRDLLSVALKGQAFKIKPYNSTGKHLTFNECITTSLAERPILPKYGNKWLDDIGIHVDSSVSLRPWQSFCAELQVISEITSAVALEDRPWPQGSSRTQICVLGLGLEGPGLGLGLGLKGSSLAFGFWPGLQH